MKNLIYLIAVIAVAIACSGPKNDTPVNSIIGDVSFTSKFGESPANAREDVRIKTHLEYVELFLRGTDVTHWPEVLRQQRDINLDLLHEYWTRGNFPKNYDHPGQRKPCFMDRDGNICAVGYLVASSEGIETARTINEQFKYADIYDIKLQEMTDWVGKSGLTVQELAMIQPQYSYTQPDNDRTSLPSALLSGVNISLITLNGIQITNPVESKRTPVLGIVFGLGQLFTGLANYPTDHVFNGSGYRVSGDKKAISLINIGLGTSTFIMSVANLRINRQRAGNSTTVSLYCPSDGKNTGIGLRLHKRI